MLDCDFSKVFNLFFRLCFLALLLPFIFSIFFLLILVVAVGNFLLMVTYFEEKHEFPVNI